MTIVLDNSQGESQDSSHGKIQVLLERNQQLFENYTKPKDCLLRLLF